MQSGNGIKCDGCRMFAWRNGELVLENDKLKTILVAAKKVCDAAQDVYDKKFQTEAPSSRDRLAIALEEWQKVVN